MGDLIPVHHITGHNTGDKNSKQGHELILLHSWPLVINYF